jgi:hypothetical protein
VVWAGNSAKTEEGKKGKKKKGKKGRTYEEGSDLIIDLSPSPPSVISGLGVPSVDLPASRMIND